MQKVTVYNQEGVIVGSQDLSDEVFGVKMNQGVVHQVVVGMMANKRQVLAHTKDRSEVRGGGRKPWKQKGTGRARHGSNRSPIWVGGGVTFGPTKERNFTKKINNKLRRKAILMCLSDRIKDEKLVLLDNIIIDKIGTKKVIKLIENLGEAFYGEIKKLRPSISSHSGLRASGPRTAGSNENKEIKDDTNMAGDKKKSEAKKKKEKPKKILMLIDKKDENIQRSCCNISWLSCVRAQDVNVLDILGNEYILSAVKGIKVIEDMFKKDIKATKAE